MRNPENLDLNQAQAQFEKAGLAFPYLPPEMLAAFKAKTDWLYGTRTGVPNLYNLDWFVNEVVTQTVENYLLLGYAGRGSNSWAIHYYLVRDHLALFLQLSWGGVYGNKADDNLRIAGIFEETAKLIELVEQTGVFKLPERLVVVKSDFYGSRWLHQATRLTSLNVTEWNEVEPGEDILEIVMPQVKLKN